MTHSNCEARRRKTIYNFKQRSVVRRWAKGHRFFFLQGTLSQNQQGVIVCFENQRFMLRNTNSNFAICYALQCKKAEVSSRVKGCLGEVLQFWEICKRVRAVHRNVDVVLYVNFCFIFQFISAQLHSKATNIFQSLWQLGVLLVLGCSQHFSQYSKLPCVRIYFEYEPMKLFVIVVIDMTRFDF